MAAVTIWRKRSQDIDGMISVNRREVNAACQRYAYGEHNEMARKRKAARKERTQGKHHTAWIINSLVGATAVL